MAETYEPYATREDLQTLRGDILSRLGELEVRMADRETRMMERLARLEGQMSIMLRLNYVVAGALLICIDRAPRSLR